ncbi:hypothetical protein [Pseudolactococcus insecticola]|uniref:Uncharacterized protein n=1 Tax=Pseudolactococcus insecticola TaxID=2709158 RepID=A0A6A0B711_9LACT|nr:hypothetical protein [Lactococcus insecticola]GFH40736.1 hypothetical protein Hs20B_11340 [Lactococcus insecticola]
MKSALATGEVVTDTSQATKIAKHKKWYNNTISYEDLSDELKKKVNINPDMNNRHIVGTQQWKDKVINYQKDLIKQGYDGKALPSKLLIDNEEAQKL